jgi:hypothetical protein
MTGLLVAIFVELITGSARRSLDAVASFEDPPRNARAARYRTAAVAIFFISAGLLLTAALLSTFANRPVAEEVCGFSGFIGLHVCVFCGFRYARLNSQSAVGKD